MRLPSIPSIQNKHWRSMVRILILQRCLQKLHLQQIRDIEILEIMLLEQPLSQNQKKQINEIKKNVTGAVQFIYFFF